MNTTMNTTSPEGVKTYKNFRFLDYKVYQESKKWFLEISTLKGVFVDQYSSLWYQLSNNMHSIVLSIAAASTKLPDQGKRSFGNAITAANKVVACLDIAVELSIITDEEYETLTEGMKGVVILLKSFIKAMNGRQASPESLLNSGESALA